MFTLKLELDPGASVETAAREACIIAMKLQVRIRFVYQGYEVLVRPGARPGDLIDKILSSTGNFKNNGY